MGIYRTKGPQCNNTKTTTARNPGQANRQKHESQSTNGWSDGDGPVSDTEDDLSKFDRKIRILNTDKAAETAMNCFMCFVLSNEDVENLGEKNVTVLDIARLHDAEHHLYKNEMKEKEINIIKQAIFSNGDGVCFPTGYKNWTDEQLLHIRKILKAFTAGTSQKKTTNPSHPLPLNAMFQVWKGSLRTDGGMILICLSKSTRILGTSKVVVAPPWIIEPDLYKLWEKPERH